VSLPAELMQLLIEALGDFGLASKAAAGISIPVSSSDLLSVRYNADDEELYITFHDGSEYRYDGVDPFTYAGLMSASSKGRYFSENIRGAYPYERV